MRSTLGQILILAGLLALGLGAARAVDVWNGYQLAARGAGDIADVSDGVFALGSVYLPIAGTLLLAGVLFSLPSRMHLPFFTGKVVAMLAVVAAILIGASVESRAFADEIAGRHLIFRQDLVGDVILQLAMGAPTLALVGTLVAGALVFWRSGRPAEA